MSVWKAHERAVARLLEGRRQPNTGQAAPDVVTDRYAIQVKHRKTLPAWLWQAIGQARSDAGDLVPVVVLCESTQGRKTRRLFMLDEQAWGDLTT